MKRSDFFIEQTCSRLKPLYKLVITACFFLLALLSLLQTNSFLSKNAPLEAKVLIVEGWLPDYALKKAMEEFQTNGYDLLITTGGPLSMGSHLAKYKDYAHIAEATLLVMGMNENTLRAVQAPDVQRDRTYHSALALKKWMKENKLEYTGLNLASLGPHSRRSSILFQKAFGDTAKIGSISIRAESYDPEQWYRSSEGVRTTINELIAYIYVVLLK